MGTICRECKMLKALAKHKPGCVGHCNLWWVSPGPLGMKVGKELWRR